MKRRKETEVAAAIVDWLRVQHWEVYQEVTYCGDIADIVAVQGPAIWVVECKTTLGLDVIAQAWRWIHYAHLVSVGTTAPQKLRRCDSFVRHILREHGIGLLQTHDGYDGSLVVDNTEDPPISRPRFPGLRDALKEEQKSFAPAGNANGSRWTPFQATCRAVLEYVNENPGVTFKELIKAIDHHYASDNSAKVSLRHWIEQGVVKGVESRLEGRALHVYPVDKKRGELEG